MDNESSHIEHHDINESNWQEFNIILVPAK
jgi:hypothetical protein